MIEPACSMPTNSEAFDALKRHINMVNMIVKVVENTAWSQFDNVSNN